MADLDQNEQDNAAMTTPDQQESAPNATSERIAELETQLEQARAETATNLKNWQMAAADLENYRKKALRDADDRVQREKVKVLNEMFDVMDNLDRALKVDESADRESLQQGLRMVQWQFAELLNKEGIAPLEVTIGEVFDPYKHDAVEHVASAEHPKDTVVEEVRKGYLMGDVTLRPARVKVSAGK
jgi:molecular chaperone GrpE